MKAASQHEERREMKEVFQCRYLLFWENIMGTPRIIRALCAPLVHVSGLMWFQDTRHAPCASDIGVHLQSIMLSVFEVSLYMDDRRRYVLEVCIQSARCP